MDLPFLVKIFLKLLLSAIEKGIEVYLLISFPVVSAIFGVTFAESLSITPSSILMIRSLYFSARCSLCETMMTSLVLLTSLMISMTCSLVLLSRAPVGSSAKIIDGSLTSARAIATRCICPPDNWLVCLYISGSRPTLISASFAFFTLSLADIPVRVRDISTLSKTLRWVIRL